MKKILLIILTVSFAFGFAKGQCVIYDTSSQFYSPDTLPCIVQGVAYYQVIQIAIPTSENLDQFGVPFSFPLTVDSVVIDSVSGFPSGITDSLNPSNGHIQGGAHACALVSGTSNDNTGTYPIKYYGTITLSGTPYPPYFSGDTTINLQTLEAYPQDPFQSSLKVIAPGASCDSVPMSTGEKSFSGTLNTSLRVYPNPNNGTFNLDLNAGGRLTCDLIIIDISGRKVYSQSLDIMGVYHTIINLGNSSKGLYAIQLRSADGFASKNISIE